MQRIWSRLRNDPYLAIVTAAGLMGLASLAPFAVYRLIQGDTLMVVLDSLMVLVAAFVLYLAWVHRRPRLAGQLLAAAYAVGTVFVVLYLPVSGLYWFYCVILLNFFIIPPLPSTLLTLASLATICSYGIWRPGVVFADNQQLVLFTTTSLLCSLFAFMFAWRTTQQRRKLQQLASLDPLTGIGNRRMLMREMDIAVANYGRNGIQCGLLLLDIDHFKQINDNHGHAAGDRVLVELARLIWNISRRTDRLFRLGGEEFVLLLPSLGEAGLEAAGNNMVRTVAAQLRCHGKPVTISIGGALLQPGDDSNSWMKRADVRLYQAKNGGRNRSVVAEGHADLRVIPRGRDRALQEPSALGVGSASGDDPHCMDDAGNVAEQGEQNIQPEGTAKAHLKENPQRR